MKRSLIWIVAVLLALALAAMANGVVSVAREIRRQSTVDEVHPADVIMVLGAAEYRGHPSPVL